MSEIKIVILKLGCIGSLPLFETILDERAEREDIDVRALSSGSKLGLKQCEEIANLSIQLKPDLAVVIGPAQNRDGPIKARNILRDSHVPSIIISDSPAKKIVDGLEKNGLGYIIIEADSLIGARREFLDPIEMAIYNSDVIRVLAVTGVFSIIVEEIDRVVSFLKDKVAPDLPRIIIDKKRAIEAAGFHNPYARSKALAAFEISKTVAKVTTRACFKISDRNEYIPLAASGHEMMRMAAHMADEAREIEKSDDSVLRRPHFRNGVSGLKRRLLDKPTRKEELS